jgi:replicative DNA helicase
MMRSGAGEVGEKTKLKAGADKPALRVVGDADTYRHVPYDIEIEQALLGAVLIDNAALERVSAALKTEYFYDPLHRRIFDAMLSLSGKLTITPLTLNAQLKNDPGLIEVGSHAYLGGLAAADHIWRKWTEI